MKRLVMAFKAFWLVLVGKDLVEKPLSTKINKESSSPKKKKDNLEGNRFERGTIYSLILLQRGGRLVDFIQESIDEYSDDQVGSAVRKIHADCKKVLKENFTIEPIIDNDEGKTVILDKNLDSSSIRFVGNIPASRPDEAILRHKGWKVSKINLPTRNDVADPNVIQAAEVEIG